MLPMSNMTEVPSQFPLISPELLLFYYAIVTLGALVGTLRGIPQLIRWYRNWMEPRPELEVLEAISPPRTAELYIRIFNCGNAMATSVRCEWVVYSSDLSRIHDDSVKKNIESATVHIAPKKTRIIGTIVKELVARALMCW